MAAAEPGATPNKNSGATPDGSQAGEPSGDDLKATVGKLREELAEAKKSAANRAEEAKRMHAKAESLLTELGGEKDREEFKEWRANREKAEQERLRKEGEFEKLMAGKDEALTKVQRELEQERQGRFMDRVDREVGDAAMKLGAVNPEQVRRLYRSDFQTDSEGRLVHKSAMNGDTGQPMTVMEFLEHERSGDAGNLFASTLKSGSGQGPGGAGEGGSGSAKPVSIRIRGGRVVEEDQKRYEEAREKNLPVTFDHGTAP